MLLLHLCFNVKLCLKKGCLNLDDTLKLLMGAVFFSIFQTYAPDKWENTRGYSVPPLTGVNRSHVDIVVLR